MWIKAPDGALYHTEGCKIYIAESKAESDNQLCLMPYGGKIITVADNLTDAQSSKIMQRLETAIAGREVLFEV